MHHRCLNVAVFGLVVVLGCGTAEDLVTQQQPLGVIGGGGSATLPGDLCGNAPGTGANTSCGGQGGLTAEFYNGAQLPNGTTFTGAADTTIDSLSAVPLGGQRYCSSKGGSNPRRCLLSWDLSSIPSNATVHWASLTFTIVDPSVARYYFYAVLRPWSESGATWTSTGVAGVPWSIPGGDDGASDSSGSTYGSVIADFAGGRTQANLDTALVQQWVSDATSNHGIMVARSSYDGLSIATGEATEPSDRPKLTVNYTRP